MCWRTYLTSFSSVFPTGQTFSALVSFIDPRTEFIERFFDFPLIVFLLLDEVRLRCFERLVGLLLYVFWNRATALKRSWMGDFVLDR